MSYKIPVYAAEVAAGIAEKVRSSASIAYCTQAEAWTPTIAWMEKVVASERAKMQKGVASITDTDLFFVKSILASTNWNKNDDVFSPQEVWAARHTPSHKPDNLNHDETIIVGHMIDSWAIDEEGNALADDLTDDAIPEFFHLLNSSVIYRAWSSKERIKSVEELIEKIVAGEALVSMECLFRGFDYAVITPDGEHRVVARDKDSAFLTKHLRAYGGTGEYEDHKIGRLMRNMTFSGKGYVDQPANEYSIVFSGENDTRFAKASQINPFSKGDGVLLSSKGEYSNHKEINDMAEGTDIKVLTEQVAELKASLKAATDENKTLAEKSTKASVEKLEKTISDLTAKLEAAVKSADEAKAAHETVTKERDEAAKTHAEIVKAKTELEAKVAKIEAEAAKVARISALVDAGVAKETATATVEKFASLSDELFKGVADLAIEAAKKAEAAMSADEKKAAEDKKKKDAAKAAADAKAAAEKLAAESNVEGAEASTEPELNGAGEGESDVTTEVRKGVAALLSGKYSAKARLAKNSK